MSKPLRHRPFAMPADRPAFSAASAVMVPGIEQIPSIDEFLDELPPIEDFLMAEETSEPIEAVDAHEPPEEAAWQPEEGPAQPVGADGWVTGSWQSFDWSSAAALNRGGRDADTEAQSFEDLEWPSSDTATESQSAADEVADALVGIARRIRSGELLIEILKGTPPEAAMAAALAVILKMRA